MGGGLSAPLPRARESPRRPTPTTEAQDLKVLAKLCVRYDFGMAPEHTRVSLK